MRLRRMLRLAAAMAGHGSAAVVLAGAVGFAAVTDVPALRIAGPALVRTAAVPAPPLPDAARPRLIENGPEPAPVAAPAPVAVPAAEAPAAPAPAMPQLPPLPPPPAATAAAQAAPAPAARPADPAPEPVSPLPAAQARPAADQAAGPAGQAAAPPAVAKTAMVPPIQRVAPRKAVPPAHAVAARELFGAVKQPSPLAARAIGSYARGCLAGAEPLAVDGPAWQAMRLSRNRNWGHPDLLRLIERLAGEAKAQDGWPGLLVGDISQPRGGPMLTGHASHQIGLDADIWLTPMPERRLTVKEREELSATSMLAADQLSVDPKVWSVAHVRLIKRAASYPEVERVLVHPAIKAALCHAAGRGPEDAWLAKVRPFWGHYFHMHIRIGCPKDSTHCTHQQHPPSSLEHGCGKELTDWLALIKRSHAPAPVPAPKHDAHPQKGPAPVTLDQLPPECRMVLEGDQTPAGKTAGR